MPKNKLKLLTIVGARPQFIKSSSISRVINKEYSDQIIEIIVHTGQHYDANMSDVFFKDLEIPKPKYNLAVGSASHAIQTANMMIKLDNLLDIERPDLVLLYGDTNSTLAGAIVASKKNIQIAHVEAGLRSFRAGMPEEINRVVTDHLAALLFCPTQAAVNNLIKEGREDAILIGDVMLDSYLHYSKQYIQNQDSKSGIFLTIHRAENTDNPELFKNIIKVIEEIAKTKNVIFAVHPRTKEKIVKSKLKLKNISLIDPLPYKETLELISNSKLVITDSGGIQKEAFFSRTRCVTLRDETEWLETLEDGWNSLITPNSKISDMVQSIEDIYNSDYSNNNQKNFFGEGDSSIRIVKKILRCM